jgi:hypothetical protein
MMQMAEEKASTLLKHLSYPETIGSGTRDIGHIILGD